MHLNSLRESFFACGVQSAKAKSERPKTFVVELTHTLSLGRTLLVDSSGDQVSHQSLCCAKLNAEQRANKRKCASQVSVVVEVVAVVVVTSQQ